MSAEKSEQPENQHRCWVRWGLFLFGWVNVIVGAVGLFVPGLPTTVFLIIAFWAFSKSSDRFHMWLWNHPRFGPAIRNWHEHRVIPTKSKIVALIMMSASFLYLACFVAESWVLSAVMAVVMVPPAIYVATRKGSVTNSSWQSHE